MLPTLFEASLTLFNHAELSTLGLPLLPLEHMAIYEAREDNNRFSHTSNLVVFQDRLYLMWSSGKIHEDAAGQVIMLSVSDDGKTWSTPAVLLRPSDVASHPDGSLMSSGWHVHDATLNAYATYSTGSYADPAISRLTAITSTNGTAWSAPLTIVPGTFLEGPRPAGDGRLALLGQGENHKPAFYHTMDQTGLTGWTPAPIANSEAIGSHWPEPSLFRRPDGTLVSTIRTKPPSKVPLCAAESSDGGLTWTAGVTTFPDTIARISAGNLPDGTAYLIGNPSPAAKRDVMTIALSRDGRVFDRAFTLLNNPPPLKFEGHAKFRGWQYPNAVIWKEMMYVAVTVGKEHVHLLRFPLALLKEPVRQGETNAPAAGVTRNTTQIHPIDKSFFEGAVSIAQDDGWLQPWRLPCDKLPLFELVGPRLPDNLHPDGDGYELMGHNFLDKILPQVPGLPSR